MSLAIVRFKSLILCSFRDKEAHIQQQLELMDGKVNQLQAEFGIIRIVYLFEGEGVPGDSEI